MSLRTRNIPWTIKYRPKKLDEYANQEEAKNIVTAWIKDWLKGKTPTKKAILLYGPPGIGKTSLVEALAGEFNLQINEMNASDYRRKEDLERIALRAATQSSILGKKRIILIDEVDGISTTADKGGLEALLEVIEKTKHPIILTANNPWHQNLRSLRDKVIMVQLKSLKQRDVISVLKRICEKERISCEDSALKIIHEKNSGDLRSCINDLQSIGEVYGKVTEELARTLTYYRDRELDPFETLRKIFTSKYSWQAKNAVTHSQIDYDMLMEWINENIPLQLYDPEDMYNAYQALARGDLYKGRIMRSGSWEFLSYIIDMIGPGVGLSRKKSRFKWVPYKFPQKIRILSETKTARENLLSASKKIAQHVHTSSRTAQQEFVPLIRILYKANKEKTILMLRNMEISPQEAQVITGDPEAKTLMEKSIRELKEKISTKTLVTEPKKVSKKSLKKKKSSGRQKTLF